MSSPTDNLEQRGTRPTVGLSISIDTEEDNWSPAIQGVTVRNIRELPKLSELFASMGVRATYFATYQVVANPDSAAVLRDIHEQGIAEIGAHLHPWNTPPECGIESRVTMLRDYPPECQREKLECLLEKFDDSLGIKPTSFRAGRFGVGRSTIELLIQSGIYVDSSVTPLLSWEGSGGPSFLSAPGGLYRLDGKGNVRVPTESGVLVEFPITVGFTRFRPSSWTRIATILATPGFRRFHILGIASRLGFLQRVVLSPETHSVEEMLIISQRLVEANTRFLHLFFHSNSLLPGRTPFVRTDADVRHLYDSLRQYVEGLQEIADVRFSTVSEAASTLSPGEPATVPLEESG
jgi:hypothetical protein